MKGPISYVQRTCVIVHSFEHLRTLLRQQGRKQSSSFTAVSIYLQRIKGVAHQHHGSSRDGAEQHMVPQPIRRAPEERRCRLPLILPHDSGFVNAIGLLHLLTISEHHVSLVKEGDTFLCSACVCVRVRARVCVCSPRVAPGWGKDVPVNDVRRLRSIEWSRHALGNVFITSNLLQH